MRVNVCTRTHGDCLRYPPSPSTILSLRFLRRCPQFVAAAWSKREPHSSSDQLAAMHHASPSSRHCATGMKMVQPVRFRLLDRSLGTYQLSELKSEPLALLRHKAGTTHLPRTGSSAMGTARHQVHAHVVSRSAVWTTAQPRTAAGGSLPRDRNLSLRAQAQRAAPVGVPCHGYATVYVRVHKRLICSLVPLSTPQLAQ